ncbi:MAG: hypothetical protein AB7N54_20675 [Alphaproteobacteria bacterium]
MRIRHLLSLAVLLLAAGPARGQVITPQDLGTLGGLTNAVAISDSGLVVGWSEIGPTPSPVHAIVWSEASGLVDIGTLGGLESAATAVNEDGQVVGWSLRANGSHSAFIWTKADGMQDLCAASQTCSATGINSEGQVTGILSLGGFTDHGFFWSPSTGVVDVGTLGGQSSQMFAISKEGRVTGWAHDAQGMRRVASWTLKGGMIDHGAFGGSWSQGNHIKGDVIAGLSATPANLWRPVVAFGTGAIQDLGTLGGDSAWASVANSSGQVAGTSWRKYNVDRHAFRWEGGVMTDLGSLGGHSDALAINEDGDVAGISVVDTGDERGFFWSSATGMLNLGTLGGNRSQAWSINNKRVIVGRARRANGAEHAALWVVP